MGLSYQTEHANTIWQSNPGYTSTVSNVGATPQWKPNDRLTVRGIFDWTQTTHAKTLPFVLTAGDYLPPETPRGYYGQNWAEGKSLAENYGGIVIAQLSRDWSLAAGIFRSVADNPISYTDLYLNTLPNGFGGAIHRRQSGPNDLIDLRRSSAHGPLRTGLMASERGVFWRAAATPWRFMAVPMSLTWVQP